MRAGTHRRGRSTSRHGVRPRIAAIAMLLMALGGGAVPAAAQQVDGLLTLDEAFETARLQNPTLLQATNQLALNDPERRTFLFGTLLPSVDLSLFSTNYRGNLQRRSTDNFGNPIESPSADWVYFSNTSQRLDLSWSIQGYSLFNAKRRRENTLLDRDLGVYSAEWTLRGQVERQFFDALEQAALLEVEEALREGRRIDVESARQRYELAGVSRVEVLNAEVQVQQQEIAVEQQRGAYEQALVTLQQTLGGAEVPGVAAVALPVFDPSAMQADDLIARAREMNPDLRQARAGVDGAEIGVREAGESWWPRLSLGYSLSRTAQAREAAALADLGYDPPELGSNFNIGLSIPAFNGYFQNRQQQAGAQIQLANQELSLEQQRLQVEADVRSGLVELKNQWRSLQIAERSAEIAGQSTTLAREEYRLGVLSFEELQNTVEQEATSRRQALTSRYAFVDALLSLEGTVGELVRPASLTSGGAN